MHIEKLQSEYVVRVSALTLCLLLCAGPSVAVPPMSVHRTNDPATVRGSAPAAVAVQSPYDDAPGVLDDGQMHVYYVEDDAGDPVRIAVHKNLPLSTVRISFDDEDPFSAPVDAALSGVTLAPATIPADGSTIALVTIFPRDAAGVPLGTGLDISLDGSALWPGSLLGPVTDEGNGLYTARILSSAPGQGDVWVTVEGILLSAEPSVTYESTSGPLSLRDEAVWQTDAITSPGGAFDQVVAGLDPDQDPGADKVESARLEVLGALVVFDENDPNRDVDALSNFLKSAVGDLSSALDDPGGVDPQTLLSLIEYVLEIARKVALHHRNAAEVNCGPCTHGGDLCQADNFLSKGDQEAASSTPDYEKVIDWYAKAIEVAVKAGGACN